MKMHVSWVSCAQRNENYFSLANIDKGFEVENKTGKFSRKIGTRILIRSWCWFMTFQGRKPKIVYDRPGFSFILIHLVQISLVLGQVNETEFEY